MKIPVVLRSLLALLPLALPVASQAQLFRAYLSINGNDANACTLPAPCRLLPAALAAVADGGEIWMLDSANYNTGTVAVTKSVSILAVPGALGSVVANGTDALNVSGSSLKVSLKNLVFAPVAGAAPAGSGVIATGTITLSIEGCTFARLQESGLKVSSGTTVEVRNSTLRDNGQQGVLVGTGSTAVISRSSVDGNDTGILVQVGQVGATTRATIVESTLSGNFIGLEASTTAAGAVTVSIEGSTISVNTIGVVAQVLGPGGPGTPSVKLARNLIVGNTNSAIMATSGGKATASANTIVGNGRAFNNGGGLVETAQNNVVRSNTNADAGSITNISLQ